MTRRLTRAAARVPLALAGTALLALALVALTGACGGSAAQSPDGAAADATGGGPEVVAPADARRETVLPCGGCDPDEWCDEAAGRCVACLANEHCPDDERCDAGVCVPFICQPGTTTCADGIERRCNQRGIGWDEVPCADGQVCVGDACRDRLCEPGTVRCRGGLLAVCAESGLSEDLSQCDEGELCVPGEGCLKVRHDILVVMDTSGSMRRVPDDPEWFEWTDPWPTCEPFEHPETRIGIARELFRRLIEDEDELLAESDFALFRFPQRADGYFVQDLATPGPRACDFGLWETVSGETMSGDDGRHVTGAGEEPDWFADGLPQVLLVPDPRAPGFAGSSAAARFDAMRPWVDGREEAGPGADATPCELSSGVVDCGLDRPCLGPEGGRTCHDVTNPELRATGGTPLGRSLFYAGEYLRRFVRVGGTPCTEAADCASSNYRCEDGVCVDPLARCRRMVVVLITDGVEDPVPADHFFRARIQAKRLHYGLGCEDTADCLGGATCRPVRVCADPAGEIGVVCEADEDCLDRDETCQPPVDVCATPDLLAAGREDPTLAAALAFVDPDGAQRVLDRDGHPIDGTVHVLDVAGGAAENGRIARLGGGLHMLHSLYDLEAIIEDLRSVFDLKAGAQCVEEL